MSMLSTGTENDSDQVVNVPYVSVLQLLFKTTKTSTVLLFLFLSSS